MLTARNAFILMLKSFPDGYDERELSEIEDKIIVAAEEGRTYIHWYHHITPRTRKLLEYDGYTIQSIEDVNGGEHLRISWN